jgi:hypothetical protein
VFWSFVDVFPSNLFPCASDKPQGNATTSQIQLIPGRAIVDGCSQALLVAWPHASNESAPETFPRIAVTFRDTFLWRSAQIQSKPLKPR